MGGPTSIGTTTADVSGDWSITSALLIGDDYTVTAAVTDLAGNTATSPGFAMTVDVVTDITLAIGVTETGDWGNKFNG